ncbi:MAG: dihydroxy-acid dehydratase [Desulfovibrio sp.]|jgi:dihydroxy-acid dehydratase|nr:dihydroxy-acid dehydratase [Desulfovibrio sp.]
MSNEKRLHPEELRSHRWYGPNSMRASAHRQRTLQMGFRRKDFTDKPIIGLINTWNELSTCHYHLKERANEARRGVWAAGGLPLEFFVLGLGEVMVKPSTMLYRNLLAMEVEEIIRSHPLDGVILMGGCDKTVPGLLMGAISAGVPLIFFPAGPMLNGHWRKITLGAGTHTKKYWEELRSGTITESDWQEIEGSICRSNGTCNTMGTASTMTSIVEAMGLTLPNSIAIPAVDSAHARMAADCGERIVEMVWEDLRPEKILTREAFLNGAAALMAIGGSTNAPIHMMAMANRSGVPLLLDDFDAVSRRLRAIVDIMPAGRFLMEDLFHAGGLSAVLARITDHLYPGCLTVNGKTLGENIQNAPCYDDEVIRTMDAPLTRMESLAVLRGNLAPDGALIKPSAATEKLLIHTGKAVVFNGAADLHARVDNPNLDVDENSVLVMKMGGPVGGPGMPEWGGMTIPRKLLKKGIRDMVRVSDARMSGTHYGTAVLHVTPEAAVGGPLALVENGDMIELDVPARKITLLVSDEELARRRAVWKTPAPHYSRGYGAMTGGPPCLDRN